MQITHLRHNEIDFQKWDVCILKACNSLIYAESWYLDIVSSGWEALISDDYEYVMPLPVKRKFGIPFLIQPPLTQQLGVFSAKKIDENIVERFIQKIPYWSYHLNLNEGNIANSGIKRPNFVLDLSKNYDELTSAYSKNTKRNIKKANSQYVEVEADLPVNDFVEFYYSTEKNYTNFSKILICRIIKKAFEKGKITLYGTYNLKKELTSILALLHSSQRLIYLLPVSNEEGKETSAMFKVIDEIIQNHAMDKSILDFEGSKIQGIARFYQGFGAELKPYTEIKHWSIIDLMNNFVFKK